MRALKILIALKQLDMGRLTRIDKYVAQFVKPSHKNMLTIKTNINIRSQISILRGRGGLVVNTSDSGSRGRGFEPHLGRRVVSLSKTYLPLQKQSTGNTQEAVAPSQHD